MRDSDEALLIVDLQPDFMPLGALPVPGGDEIVKPIADIVSQFSTVVATQDWHPSGHISFASRHRVAPFSTIMVRGTEQTVWPDHCVQGSANAALHKDLPLDGVTVILRKGTNVGVDSYSAFRENEGEDGQRKSTGLGALLQKRGIRRIYMCGLARDYCVKWSALDAGAEGFEVVVLDDLCRSVDKSQEHQVSQIFDNAGILHIHSRLTTFFLGR